VAISKDMSGERLWISRAATQGWGFWVRFAPPRQARDRPARDVRQNGTWLCFAFLSLDCGAAWVFVARGRKREAEEPSGHGEGRDSGFDLRRRAAAEWGILGKFGEGIERQGAKCARVGAKREAGCRCAWCTSIKRGGDARLGPCARIRDGERWVFRRISPIFFLFLSEGGGARARGQADKWWREVAAWNRRRDWVAALGAAVG
jgi:hypothetical protein